MQEEVHSYLAMKLHPMTPNADAIAPIYAVLLCSNIFHTLQEIKHIPADFNLKRSTSSFNKNSNYAAIQL